MMNGAELFFDGVLAKIVYNFDIDTEINDMLAIQRQRIAHRLGTPHVDATRATPQSVCNSR